MKLCTELHKLILEQDQPPIPTPSVNTGISLSSLNQTEQPPTQKAVLTTTKQTTIPKSSNRLFDRLRARAEHSTSV